jgi:hypothetical protein
MFTGPNDNINFDSNQDINKLAGIYSNKGEGSDLTGVPYLSEIIWNNNEQIDHDQISTIEVKVIDSQKVLVNAYKGNIIFKTETFIKGKDFELKDGKLRITREAGMYKNGSIIVGPYYENIELGIDKRGDGKYRQSYTVGGLAFLVIPVAAGGRDDFRYKRLVEIKR